MAELPSGTVTFLFTDLEGSTRLWEQYPDAMKEALARHDEILRDAIIAHDGYIVKMTGDGMHAAFADAARAVRAAVDVQRTLATEAWGEPGELRVRMGLHTGSAEQRDGDYFGTTLNRAARLMSVAHGGQIVISLATEEVLGDTVEPGVELIDLGEHQLRDLATPMRVFQLAHADLPRGFPPLRSLDVFRGNVPVQPTSFVGREQELAALGDALRTSRIVTITGVGGVGKTRLAVQTAADLLPRFADGVWVCELAGATDAESLDQVVATTLGVSPRAGIAIRDAIAEFLRAKEVLLVFDNCEHLLDATGALATTLIHRCPGLRLLATSREGLSVDGEQVWPLRSLAVGPSTELFVERARAVKPTFVLDTGNAAALEEVCARLDGVPLAIELAAARVASMSPLEIARRLDERFRLLTGGRRSAVERHQTLRATVDWSYSLLDARNRVVFERLGVFVGGFDADAAVAVASGDGIEEWDVLDGLADLVAKSLLVSEDTGVGTTRYEMLETLRHYARERLDEHADAETRRRLHAEHYAAFAEEAGREVRGRDEFAWRARIRAELDNLRAAVTWSLDSINDDNTEFGVRIVVGLALQQGYDPSLGIGPWAVRALDRLGSTTPARRQIVRAAAAYCIAMGGDYAAARDLALDAWGEGVLSGSSWPWYPAYALAYVEFAEGNDDVALRSVEGAIAELGDRLEPMDRVTLHAVAAGSSANWAGDAQRARPHAQQALESGRRSGSPSGLAAGLFAYGVITRPYDPEAAREALDECIALVETGATPVMYGYALAAVAPLRAAAGEHIGALCALRDAFRYAAETGNEALTQAIRAGALPVLVELGAAEFGLTLVPSGWLTSVQPPAIGGGFGNSRDQWQTPIESVRAELGADGFARVRARAEAMSSREIVDYALAELDRLIGERSND